jgi:LysR substrate binding domain
VAVPAGHPLARFEHIPVTALRGEPLILLPRSPLKSFSAKLEQWLAHQMAEEPNVVAYEPPDQALEAVARSSSLISFANGSRAASRPVPGIAYRPLSPELFIDFGLAYFRDDESPTLANFLRLIDGMPEGIPEQVPEGGEVITGDERPPGTTAVPSRPPIAASARD